jgi:hydroxypyruvate isomerase
VAAIKQSFAWWCVQDLVINPEQFFTDLKEIGYQGVELLPQSLWPIAQHAGLAIASVGVGSLTHGLNRLDHHDVIEAELRQKIKLADKFNITNLIVFSGNRMGLDDEAGVKNTVDGLRRLAPLAEANGVNLVLELLNSKVDHHDYMCDHTAWAIDVVKQVSSPNVKILYDIYHMQIMEGDIIRTISAYGSYFGHVHTAGNPGRRDLDDEQELNYPAIFRALKDVGYQGFIGHEFIPKDDPFDALQKAYQLCNL